MEYNKTVWVDNSAPAINATNLNKIENQLETLTNAIYPVGSIYLSVNNTNPSTLFGGTWEQIKDTFLLSAGDTYTAGSTGGEAEHRLTKSEIPQIDIRTKFASSAGGDGSGLVYGTSTGGSNNALVSNVNYGSDAFSIMPPYLTVYMWKRTA